ncbi:MAG: IMP dehydrogenase, partial [Candidatus Korarchaeota archaeon]|nr:IMP dehydrogenase [Candidatus Korarchaeota archaeon]
MFRRKLQEAPLALTFSDVVLLPSHTSVEPREVDLHTAFSTGVRLNIPIVSSPMDTVTGHMLAAELARLGGIGVLHRNMGVERQVSEAVRVKEADPGGTHGAFKPLLDEEGRLRVAAAISPFDAERAEKLDRHVDVLVSDVAHFHNSRVMDAARRLVKRIGVDFIAGNIGTYEAALDVVSKIEDVAGLRVGVASGSICSTGEVTGVAAPTLYAVASVAGALHERGARIPVIADGGIRGPGDGAKALAAGASSLMLGYVLAGTDEASGPLVIVENRCFK